MPDVDLFVGVTSIAADPDWTVRGEDRYAGYWRTATFGALTASAEVRRDVLERFLPRLKIADRCTLDGRFLIVCGDLGTYKIHLGSANILMEPDDAYLCIVPASSPRAGMARPRWVAATTAAFLCRCGGADVRVPPGPPPACRRYELRLVWPVTAVLLPAERGPVRPTSPGIYATPPPRSTADPGCPRRQAPAEAMRELLTGP